ncbi:MAG: 3-oxoacyl-[acyl-carrier-protein] reductase [Lachnospiraceae bacterium]|nr:3-oxoacyl-[acyl-carrier-protein] reductase [Lachnospiraceae bacterium]
MDLTGKTAVVTGGSRGIGRAICVELARRGANVVLCARSVEGAARETADLCGSNVIVVPCNVADAADVKNLMETAREAFGRIDILVNNAGITRDGLLMRMKEEDFDAVIATNLKGAFLCMKEVSGVMMRQRYGRIVNISSVVGIHGNAGQMNYAASKAGVIGMTKSMARELGSRGVTVNAVAPGFIDTDMTAALSEKTKGKMEEQIPLKRIGAPEDVAKAVAFLVSDEASYITGQVLCVDGGMGI